jgi:hypothetical protein
VILPRGTILDISFPMKDDTPNNRDILEQQKASKTFQYFTLKIPIIPQAVPL